jgi:F420-0:gamma-glutamyl ligase-like protein
VRSFAQSRRGRVHSNNECALIVQEKVMSVKSRRLRDRDEPQPNVLTVELTTLTLRVVAGATLPVILDAWDAA